MLLGIPMEPNQLFTNFLIGPHNELWTPYIRVRVRACSVDLTQFFCTACPAN